MIISSQSIKNFAQQYGFDICGIAKIHNLSQQSNYISNWIEKGYNGEMRWFDNYANHRVDPTLLVEQAKSVVVCARYYNPQIDFGSTPKIAKYALDTDYHYTIRQSLSEILESLGDEVSGGCFCDSAPILERYWAELAGVGWRGRNGLITTTEFGSMIYLGVIVLDCEVDSYDSPTLNRCGSCSRCVDSCPTDSIKESGVVDCRSCISYITIEQPLPLTDSQVDILSNNNPQFSLFGCDICVDSCPWSQRASRRRGYTTLAESKFVKSSEQWSSLGTNQFRKNFRTTPLSRAGAQKIRTIATLISK